ncbi:SNF2 helicase-associated domain-containing protein [Nitriliruptor sp.]|uniref:SNF2 helicase-associated domain-containing protein n=1 Tax=Nitriliruptor sp. TaxID=2448056 RepID=UPI0034A0AB2C
MLAFLGDTASLLEQAGFGVLLPDEPRRPARLGARLQTSARRRGPSRARTRACSATRGSSTTAGRSPSATRA